jgi:multiple sugar transport system permease protein
MSDRTLKYLLLLPALLIVGLTTLYPLAFSLVTSFREWDLTRDLAPSAFVGVDNYVYALTEDYDFYDALRVTVWFVVLDVVATIAIALGLAVILRRNGPLHRATRVVLILPFAMSPALIGISWRFMFNPEVGVFTYILGTIFPPLRGQAWLADPTLAMVALVSCDVWHWMPYMTLVLLGGLASLPRDSEEAARIDGASEWRVFRDVTLPQLRPVIAVVTVLKTVFALKMFDQVVTLTGGGPGNRTQTLAYLVYRVAFSAFDMGQASALAWILTTVLIALGAYYMRFLLPRVR